MINALHLLWIIPLSAWFGFAVCAVLAAGKSKRHNNIDALIAEYERVLAEPVEEVGEHANEE